jgi:hypothetical protein
VWPIRVELPFVYLSPFVIYHCELFTLVSQSGIQTPSIIAIFKGHSKNATDDFGAVIDLALPRSAQQSLL